MRSLHALYVHRLAHSLNQHIKGCVIKETYSLESTHLVIELEKNKAYFGRIQFRILGDESLFIFDQKPVSVSKTKLKQFNLLEGKTIRSVEAHSGDRSFHVSLENSVLYFFFHGRNAYSAYSDSNIKIAFPNRFSSEKVPAYESSVVLANQAIPNNNIALFESPLMNDFLLENFKHNEAQGKKWNETLSDYLNGNVYLNDTTQGYEINSYARGKTISEFTDIVDSLNSYAEIRSAQYYFEQHKAALINRIKQELNSIEKKLKSLIRRRNDLLLNSTYRHWGDLLQSNVLALTEGLTRIELVDYLSGETIQIPLQEKLSPQQNIERYYRKAKSQQNEEARVESEILSVSDKIKQLNGELYTALQSSEMKHLRGMMKEVKKKAVQEQRIPYHLFYYQDFQILVGKQAKDNDELTLKIAKKDDLWLHARDVPGSHVIIRKKAGCEFPEKVQELAGGLALWFSKRKQESLAPVIVTQKKFVRKRKGDAAGAVVVEKEKVIMVEPVNPEILENKH